jgi:hypothetical protein
VTRSIKYENVFYEIFISDGVAMDMNVSCTIFRVAAATCNIPPPTTLLPPPPPEKTTDSYCIFSGARTPPSLPSAAAAIIAIIVMAPRHKLPPGRRCRRRRLFDTLYLARDAVSEICTCNLAPGTAGREPGTEITKAKNKYRRSLPSAAAGSSIYCRRRKTGSREAADEE